MKRNFRPFNTLQGITLLENLIALLILSIGLLGLAGLQASSFRNSKDATYRAIATQQAADMLNRIRVNTAGVVSGEYDNIKPVIPSLATPCNTSICNAADLATFDTWEWNTRNAAVLPDGSGTVVATPLTIASIDPLLTPVQFTVTVRWDGNRTGAKGLGCIPTATTDLNCVTLQIVAP